jgi:putative ABC transport system permease protein
MEIVRNEFAAMPGVSAATLSYEIPNGMNGGQPSVYKTGTDSTQAVAMQDMATDENYLSTYQIALKAGSFFRGGEKDSSGVVINEKAVATLGWKSAEEAIGKQVKISGSNLILTIQGVTDNFHFNTMQQEIAPMILFQVRLVNAYRFLSFKIKPGNIGATLEAIQKKWATLLPGSSFEYRFMDEVLKKLYASELQMKKAAYTATVLTLIIVLLGVLGLISLSVQKRTKEIGVRKILGASPYSIVSLFLKEFLPVLLVGGIISIPVAWYVMRGWLNDYAYRISLTPQPFLISITILGCITTIVISLQTAKTSAQNPVKNLRTE